MNDMTISDRLHETQDPSGQSLWSRLPDEIKQEILKHVFSDLTVKFRGKPDSVTHTSIQGTEHCTVELRKASRYLLPNLFLISKAELNKDEIVDAIVRTAQIRFQTMGAVDSFSKQLTDSQRKITKRILFKKSRLLPLDLTTKLGRYEAHLVDPLDRSPDPIKSILYVPRTVLVEQLDPTFIGPSALFPFTERFFKLEDTSNFDKLPVPTQAMVALLFVQPGSAKTHSAYETTELGRFFHAARRQNIKVTVEFDLMIEATVFLSVIEDSIFRATFSTNDLTVRASNGKVGFSLAQDLSREILDKRLTADGYLRDPNFITREYVQQQGFIWLEPKLEEEQGQPE